MSKAVGVLLAVVALLVGACFLLGVFHGTDVAFQSSDGNWADAESQMKGRTFQGIEGLFEKYKQKCAAPAAQLERTTPAPQNDIPWSWFNDYSDPKWQIPYHEARREGRYYPSCALTQDAR